ncbi:malonate decarboxylase acyl carrier protein [Burkholderia sp. Ch1-1]|uniref:Malonate decarboxylase acyl carrier protein n=1 Tax=Paraburkholderia dioscoreae TaxID=2604047 RepID=A0A5Q4YWD6_9BURK|nr:MULTISPECIES: malonate decarboxylase subunit delta [Paraburkholderia]EIF34455.1 malonate decarboxylase acyl carrier protein [Burkholderia sp. Ch1-1]MDR8395321.1 malonate decarboxylase subunit delta [Paraburkholderia sp. USG1]VVD33395.1 Malonate decarboxylase acyl carrier protein [Paraburkholderia dioscoreae]
METLRYEYPVSKPVKRRVHVGVVGSGDLEVLIEPVDGDTAQVVINTSVDGFGRVWKTVVDRFFTRFDGRVAIEINDFGATPGVVLLRLEQAVEELGQ